MGIGRKVEGLYEEAPSTGLLVIQVFPSRAAKGGVRKPAILFWNLIGLIRSFQLAGIRH